MKDFGPFQQDADGKDERKKKRLVAGKAQIEEKTRQKIPEGWFATLEDGPDCQRADRRHDFFRGSQLDFWQEGRYMAEKTA
ncbi:MAG: hypothetical protein LBU12_03515 [Deltaproteobacteria bacterium]|nr:hypothetical protein [Deltaproteobacteria bacterium]